MMKKFPLSTWLLLIIPSLLGVFLFITPIPTSNGIKVPIAIFANWLDAIVEPGIQLFVFIIFVIAAIGSIVMHFIPQEARAR